MFEHCTRSKNRQKVITRHVWEDHKEKVRQHRLSVSGKTLYKKRKNRAKLCRFKTAAWHGLRYCRLRGKRKVSEQVLLTAA
ncbi:transposase [Bacillus haynesii]|uniref:transposase n=1 Tax=Bacillus haynesii TaxID=1925021 RepID=UPI0015F4D0A0